MINVLRYLRESTALGAKDISGYTITNAALDYSESFQPGGMDEVALFISPGATATGTGPAFTATLQVSPDGGTTWFAVKNARPSTTDATVVVATTSGNYSNQFDLPVVETGEASKPLYRFAFTYANADNDFESVSMWLAMRKRNQRHP